MGFPPGKVKGAEKGGLHRLEPRKERDPHVLGPPVVLGHLEIDGDHTADHQPAKQVLEPGLRVLGEERFFPGVHLVELALAHEILEVARQPAIEVEGGLGVVDEGAHDVEWRAQPGMPVHGVVIVDEVPRPPRRERGLGEGIVLLQERPGAPDGVVPPERIGQAGALGRRDGGRVQDEGGGFEAQALDHLGDHRPHQDARVGSELARDLEDGEEGLDRLIAVAVDCLEACDGERVARKGPEDLEPDDLGLGVGRRQVADPVKGVHLIPPGPLGRELGPMGLKLGAAGREHRAPLGLVVAVPVRIRILEGRLLEGLPEGMLPAVAHEDRETVPRRGSGLGGFDEGGGLLEGGVVRGEVGQDAGHGHGTHAYHLPGGEPRDPCQEEDAASHEEDGGDEDRGQGAFPQVPELPAAEGEAHERREEAARRFREGGHLHRDEERQDQGEDRERGDPEEAEGERLGRRGNGGVHGVGRAGEGVPRDVPAILA